jgi:hypothetical protein
MLQIVVAMGAEVSGAGTGAPQDMVVGLGMAALHHKEGVAQICLAQGTTAATAPPTGQPIKSASRLAIPLKDVGIGMMRIMFLTLGMLQLRPPTHTLLIQFDTGTPVPPIILLEN